VGADGRKRDATYPPALVEHEEDVCFRELLPHFHTAYSCFKTAVYYAAALLHGEVGHIPHGEKKLVTASIPVLGKLIGGGDDERELRGQMSVDRLADLPSPSPCRPLYD